MARSKQQHLDPTAAPKRILSLDGGGIRGILTLEYLSAIENMLKQRSGRQDFVLSEYFDLIGGTSTGSIIAAGLACGMSVDQLKRLYRELGNSIFVNKFWKKGILTPKFASEPVQEALDAQLGAETTLDSDRIRVHKVTAAIDCGTAVNPLTIEAQVQSGLVFGLSAALFGRITFNDGRVEQSNFTDYPVLRINEMPETSVHIVASNASPTGVGECGTPPIAPAVANALFQLTGKRLRKLPFDLGAS